MQKASAVLAQVEAWIAAHPRAVAIAWPASVLAAAVFF